MAFLCLVLGVVESIVSSYIQWLVRNTAAHYVPLCDLTLFAEEN